MTVEERRIVPARGGGGARIARDPFPAGMRVLAVDDDPTCLKVLEALLRRCSYQVTTTCQAITALQMLRDNKGMFDLVISDVHMPDMDGFKLLELVGLEMDLPVIMLSVNGETSTVMKGITHGAVDYLLKPVRIEELKNIWQHVVRRKRFDHRDSSTLDNVDDNGKAFNETFDGVQDIGSSDRNAKINKKRKDQNERGDEDDGDDENAHENDDPSTQKKPRVVWSVDLHRKFVAAVNQLGIDKAVPKRILDLMNVEGLTRENVASHLQKYRLYLRRISALASQQANFVASYGGRDSSCISSMGSLNAFRNYHPLAGVMQLPGISSLQPIGVPIEQGYNGMALRGLASGIVQFGGINNTNNPVNDFGKIQGLGLASGNQHGNQIQGDSSRLEIVQSPPKHRAMLEAKSSLSVGFNNGFSPSNIPIYSESISLLQVHQPFELSSSPHLPDLGRCNGTWEDAASSLTRYPSSNLGSLDPFPDGNSDISAITTKVITSVSPQTECNYHDISTSYLVPASFCYPEGSESKSQAPMVCGNMLAQGGIPEDSKLPSFGRSQDSAQKCEDRTLDHMQRFNFSSRDSAFCPTPSSMPENQRFNISRSSFVREPLISHQFTNDKFGGNPSINREGCSISGTSKLQGGFGSTGCGLDDLVNAIKQERDDVAFVDGGVGCDMYPMGACL